MKLTEEMTEALTRYIIGPRHATPATRLKVRRLLDQFRDTQELETLWPDGFKLLQDRRLV